MKTRKAMVILLAACCLAAMFSLEATAAAWVSNVTVDSAGPYGTTADPGTSYVYLTHNADPPLWVGSKRCTIGPSRGKEFLAVALTALANGKTVNVYGNLTAGSPTITGIYVNKN